MAMVKMTILAMTIIQLTTINTCYLKASEKHYRISYMSTEPPTRTIIQRLFQMVMVKWAILTDISTISTNVNDFQHLNVEL
jgi:hypothetical protein